MFRVIEGIFRGTIAAVGPLTLKRVSERDVFKIIK